MTNRAEALGAIAGFISYWNQTGRVEGETPFAAFPKWGKVVGGIMKAADLGDPCALHADKTTITGDRNTEDMKVLFDLAHDTYREYYITKKDLYNLLKKQEDLFSWIDLETRSGQTALGKLLVKFEGRALSGLTMVANRSDRNKPRFAFIPSTKVLLTSTDDSTMHSLTKTVTSSSRNELDREEVDELTAHLRQR